MDSCPFRDHSDCFWRQVTLQDAEIIDSYNRIVFIVNNMKMGRAVISKVHLDDYAVEAAYGWHRSRVIGQKVFVNPALVQLSAWIAIPTPTSCQGEKHACRCPTQIDLDPYNIELSGGADSSAKMPVRAD
jgi:hypothetical protein